MRVSSKAKHEISAVMHGSIAHELDILPGDFLLTINGERIKDALHYNFLTEAEELTLEIEKASEPCLWELEIEKDPDEELGLVFTRPNMSPTRKCRNKCVFCFVAQQPLGLRRSLYVKDDDFWLSYLMGNYITLTNLDDGDIQRMAHFHLSPLRISVHAADMDLRQKMMGNKKAGDLFKILDVFSDAGIEMHFQAVICRRLNDGEKLKETIDRLSRQPGAKSLAIVPAGITRHRDGLYPLTQFSQDEAAAVINIVEGYKKRGFVFAADEWYIMAKMFLPNLFYYRDFPQLDNGVGMIRLFEKEFNTALMHSKRRIPLEAGDKAKKTIGIITGQAAAEFMQTLADKFEAHHPNVKINIHAIKNNFFGELITVSGLLTGQDIIGLLAQPKENISTADISEGVIFLPQNALRDGTEIMLDGMTVKQLSAALGIPVKIGNSNGGEFCRQLQEE